MKWGPMVPLAVHWGPVGSPQVPGALAGTPEASIWVCPSIVHRYGTVERSVEPRRVPPCQNRVPTETRRTSTQPDGTSPDRSLDCPISGYH